MAYKKPAFQLPFGILNTAEEPVDVRYGPYTGIGNNMGECFHADSPMTPGNRYVGLTIGIIVNNKVEEYWFEHGTADIDLVKKTSSSSGGGTGDLNFTHYQPSAETIWNITHNLNKKPSVTTFDTANSEIVGEVFYDSTNQMHIEFSQPVNGIAYLN